jgi:ankyrin repeat protein
LHVAVENKKVESINALLRNGANPDLVDDDGEAPLHLAAARDYLHAGEALINARCQLNLKDKKGNRPVDLAGMYSSPKMFAKLVAAGAEGPHKYTPRATAGGI